MKFVSPIIHKINDYRNNKKSIKRTISISIPNHRNQWENLLERQKKAAHNQETDKTNFKKASKVENACMYILALLRLMLL